MQSRSEAVREFFAAVHGGEVEQVRRMLRQDPSLNQEEDGDCLKYRALNVAVWRNNRAVVDAVLESGADIDAYDSFENGPWNALQHALNYHHLEMAEYLVERGAAIDVHSAAGLARMKRLTQMLDSDPDLVHARGGDGKMPLHFAANPVVAAFLLQRGAEIEARDLDHFSTPAQWAADHRPAVSRFLVEQGAQPDIFMAVASGDLNWVKEMIAANPAVLRERINEERFPGPEPGQFRSIYLYTRGMGVNATPLHAAASRNFPQAVQLLLAAGLDANLRGGYDDGAPLHFAAWNDHAEMVTLLLDHGAEIDMESGKMHRNSPLGWAIVSGAVRAVGALLERGAVIESHHLKDALRGAEGEFKSYSQAPPQSYRQIYSLLKSALK